MLALQVLYEVDLTDHDPEEAMARAFAEHEPVTPDVVEHVRSLVRGVGQHRDELDPVIAGAAPARDLAEQAAIERNVLRLAAYELLNVPECAAESRHQRGRRACQALWWRELRTFINGVLRTDPRGAPPRGWEASAAAIARAIETRASSFTISSR